jgi:hypothetical protein
MLESMNDNYLNINKISNSDLWLGNCFGTLNNQDEIDFTVKEMIDRVMFESR